MEKKMGFLTLSRSWVLVGALALTACSSGVKLDDVATNGSGTDTSTSGAYNADANGVGKGGRAVEVAVDPLNDPNSPLAQRSIYFDFDSYVVKSEYKNLLENHARYLNSNKTRKVILQGNADERGTTEYNLALGQKRSESVRQAFKVLGVSDNQLEAVSFGKEKPKATGHDESAWSQNRRVDIAY
jgi:peptidoglycan-associated lipoprotein